MEEEEPPTCSVILIILMPYVFKIKDAECKYDK